MYKSIAGDTFESISRKTYGTEAEASRIRAANPDVGLPIPIGTEIITPIAPLQLNNKIPANDPDEVAVIIDGKRFRFWTSISVNREVDSISSISLSAPLDYEDTEFKAAFRPFSYKSLVVTVGGERLFTGTIITVLPVLASDKVELSINAYSLPGVLMDCTPSASNLPIEFNNATLKYIANHVIKPFGITVDFKEKPGAVFERVAFELENKIFDALVNLAQQRNLIIQDTPQGGLLFTKAIKPGNPVANLKQGEFPLLSVSPQFNAQNYYSHITGVTPSIVGLFGGQYTYKNPALKGVFRPYTFSVPDTAGIDAKTAVMAKAGHMLGEAVSYTIELSTWRTPAGDLWAPNATLRLVAPGAMIYRPYEFLIRSVSLERAADSLKSTLSLVIPGSYSGELPGGMPWD